MDALLAAHCDTVRYSSTAMMNRCDMLILIGPNGVGKTTIGHILAHHFRCQFISIETFFLGRYATLADYRSQKDQAYHHFEAHIRHQQTTWHLPIIFEEVGLSMQAQSLIANLQQDFRVSLVKILADEAVCAQRVQRRDLQHNYPKSPALLLRVYHDFVRRAPQLYTFELEVINNQLSEEAICGLFTRLLAPRPSPSDV